MSKFRKNSLSPCYIPSSNKENYNTENVLCFKNICNSKRTATKRSDVSPHHLNNFSTIYTAASVNSQQDETNGFDVKGRSFIKEPSQRNVFKSKERLFEEDGSFKQCKNEQEYKDTLKSKEKQISSLHSQVRALQNTCELLKNQVESLSKENKQLMTNTNFSRRPEDKLTELDKITKQNGQLKKQLKDFQQIVPKLNELEDIQNILIEENKKLKSREDHIKGILKNVKTLVMSEPSQTNNKVLQLLHSLIY